MHPIRTYQQGVTQKNLKKTNYLKKQMQNRELPRYPFGPSSLSTIFKILKADDMTK